MARGQAQDPGPLDPVRLMLVTRDGADRCRVTVQRVWNTPQL